MSIAVWLGASVASVLGFPALNPAFHMYFLGVNILDCHGGAPQNEL